MEESMATKIRNSMILAVVILSFVFPISASAEAEIEYYKMPDYVYYCGMYCYEYITLNGFVQSVVYQDGLGEITISGWRERTTNIYYNGALIETRISYNQRMANNENLHNMVFKLKDYYVNTNYTQNLTCEVTFDLLENVIDGQPSLVFDHGEEYCYTTPRQIYIKSCLSAGLLI
jgi:hypothetical protein